MSQGAILGPDEIIFHSRPVYLSKVKEKGRKLSAGGHVLCISVSLGSFVCFLLTYTP